MDVDGIGVARIDALLMSIRAALSKARAKIEIPGKICQPLRVSEDKTTIDGGRARFEPRQRLSFRAALGPPFTRWPSRFYADRASHPYPRESTAGYLRLIWI